MNNLKGLFITFEGPEASGKSSQIILLKKFLIKKKIPFKITREPGGTKLSEKLRNLILNKDSSINLLEEIMLLMAARSHHINNILLPNLKKGKIVISDRYADSTFVYQGYVNNFGIKKAQNLHKVLLNNFLPHKTFLFNLTTSKIINRLKKRKSKNKYDKLDRLFHEKVNIGYAKVSKNKRFIHLNASLSKQTIHNQILKNLNLK